LKPYHGLNTSQIRLATLFAGMTGLIFILASGGGHWFWFVRVPFPLGDGQSGV
jgi:hypothetical protein